MPLVKFIKENKEIEVPAGANLRKEAIKAGINVHQGVNGFGAGINKIRQLPRPRPVRHVPREDHQGHGKRQPDGHDGEDRGSTIPLPDPLPCMALRRQRRHDAAGLPDARCYGDMEVETGPELNLFGENFFS